MYNNGSVTMVLSCQSKSVLKSAELCYKSTFTNLLKRPFQLQSYILSRNRVYQAENAAKGNQVAVDRVSVPTSLSFDSRQVYVGRVSNQEFRVERLLCCPFLCCIRSLFVCFAANAEHTHLKTVTKAYTHIHTTIQTRGSLLANRSLQNK